MSKADEMFEKLGYDIEIWTETVEYKMDRYAIVFNLTNKSVEIQNYFSPKSYITMQELQTIYQKCKELRMDRMSEEEAELKRAIDILKSDYEEIPEIETVLNMLEKKDKEAQQYFETTIIQSQKFDEELEKRDKIIEELAKAFRQDDVRSVEEIIRYFEEKVKDE